MSKKDRLKDEDRPRPDVRDQRSLSVKQHFPNNGWKSLSKQATIQGRWLSVVEMLQSLIQAVKLYWQHDLCQSTQAMPNGSSRRRRGEALRLEQPRTYGADVEVECGNDVLRISTFRCFEDKFSFKS